MSWSRPVYDVKAYEQSLKESQGPGVYYSGTPIINKPFEISLLINLIKGWTNLYEFKTRNDIEMWLEGKLHLEVNENIKVMFSGDKEYI